MHFLSGNKSAWNKKLFLSVLLLILGAVLLVCWKTGRDWERNRKPGETGALPEAFEDAREAFPKLTIDRMDRETEAPGAKTVDLSSCGKELLITEGGEYRLTGAMNGRITIRAEEQTVHLVLDNVTVSSPEGPAVYAESAGKLVMTAEAGTENFFSDSAHYAPEEPYEACVYCACDLTLNGSGSLTVNGYHQDAVRSRDVAKILDVRLSIRCKRTGVHGKDGIHVAGGRLVISSEKYGLKTTKKGKNGKGVMMLSGGEHSVVAGRYAFVCTRSDLYLFDCQVKAKSVSATYDVTGTRIVGEGCVR